MMKREILIDWLKYTGYFIVIISIISCKKTPEVSHPEVFQEKQTAIFKVPNTKYKISIEREAIHQTLAEYKRTLIFTVANNQIRKIDMFTDTGGYSKTDLFKINDFKYILRDKLNDCYVLNLSNETLKKETLCDEINTKNIELIGSFDTDNSKVWRFISKNNGLIR